MDFLELAREARSCRRFKENEPLTERDLDWLLECARLAPSARNAQELRFITVNKEPVLGKLFGLTKWAGALKDWGGPAVGERPTAFIAVLMPDRGGELLYIDTGIACQTMQLAATSRGWGACMIYSFERKGATQLLAVPESYRITLLLGLGVANEVRRVVQMPPDGNFTYWRDDTGTHYVPKRALAELVLARY